MYRIAIVEDERECQQQLIENLHKIETEIDERFIVRVFNDGIDILDGYSADYDIVFLDIKMKHIDGMETAKKIREVDAGVPIIFITSLAQYAIEGYKVQAMDFILKPVSFEQLFSSMNHILHTIQKWKKDKMLRVFDGEIIKKVSTTDIAHIEVINHDIYVYSYMDKYQMRGQTLTNLENELNEYYFVRANQSVIINLKFVDEIIGDEVRCLGKTVYLSRSRKKEFLKKFALYIGMEI